MKLMERISLVGFLILLIVGAVSANPKEVVEKTALITNQCKIYREMSPESEALIRAYKGETFAIKDARKVWLKVETPKGDGWLNRSNCRTDSREKSELNGKPQKLFIFITVLILALIAGIIIFVRQQNQEDSYI